MHDDPGGGWSREDAARRRRVRRMLREMERMDQPGLAGVPAAPRRPRGRFSVRSFALSLVVLLAAVAYADGTHLFASAMGWWSGGQQAGTTTSTAYSLLRVQPGTKDFAVSYDGCQPLHYRVNLDGAPPEDPQGNFVFAAVRRVEQASGLHFVYDGTSVERPHWGTPVTGGPILIGFAEPSEVGQLGGDVIGIGGSARTVRGRLEEYTTGSVTLDQDAMTKLFTRPQGPAYAQAVVMHELGHVLGLGHVQDPGEIMNPEVDALDWGPGDLQGLKIVGHGPCF